MYVIAEFTIVPIGVGVSLSPYVAACERILQTSGLTYELHANGTNIEGEWEEVFAVIRRCHEALHAMGAPRLHTDIKIGTRTDRPQKMAEKVASVRAKLAQSEKERQ
jgi:uncharacterized protein (TIGR00106 family)